MSLLRRWRERRVARKAREEARLLAALGITCAHCHLPFAAGERRFCLDGISGAWDDQFHERCVQAVIAGLEV